MGRLLRKKTASKKKKFKQRENGVPSAQANADAAPAATKNSHFTDTLKGGRKKETSLQKRFPSSSKSAPKSLEKNRLQKGMQFLREVKIELKKVAWPSRKQTIGSTVVVIILVMIISMFLGVADMGLSSLVRVVLQ